MQKNKIKKITLKGFRGVKESIEIDLKNNNLAPLLIYGDNGTGKSTITDSIEWFIYDRISHLKGEEIVKNEGIRNKELNKTTACEVDIEFSNPSLCSKKTLEIKNDKFFPKYSNTTDIFNNYLKKSSMENLIIRNNELVKFIISSKGKRLEDISDLIGYSEVKKIKDILKKSVNQLKRIFQNKNFKDQIVSKQTELLKLFNESINNENQFFLTISSIAQKAGIEFEINSWESFKKLETELSKVKIDSNIQLKFKIIKELSNITAKESALNQLFNSLGDFQNSFKQLFESKEKLKGVKIKPLLKTAEHIIKSKVLNKQDECPLCLQEISAEELLNSIKNRLKAFQVLEADIDSLNQTKENIKNNIMELGELLKRIEEMEYPQVLNPENMKEQLKDHLLNFRNLYKIFSSELNFSSKTYYDEYIALVKLFSLEQIKLHLKDMKEAIKEKPNPQIDLIKKISLAKSFFTDFQKLKKEEQLLRLQIQTMNEIYKKFSDYQKKEMELFLSSVSSNMNNFFIYLNPNDNIKDIKLKPLLDNDGDFGGISCHLNFRNTVLQTPKMLLSESYLNCLGLCLFLSSVKLFNKENKFFILDDVISSFDKNHRLQFGRLLLKEFSEWQMLILTHEDEWFKFLSYLVKPKNWIIKKMKWSSNIGSFIDENYSSLKEKIEQQIKDSNVDGLGNKIGRYVEKLLKQICQNLEAEVKAKFDGTNGKRSPEELLNALGKRIKKKKMGLEDHEVIKNLRNNRFFRNETSHDNEFNENLADMKICFQDIIKFEKLFICPETKEHLLSENALNGKIQTKSGKLSYDWK